MVSTCYTIYSSELILNYNLCINLTLHIKCILMLNYILYIHIVLNSTFVKLYGIKKSCHFALRFLIALLCFALRVSSKHL